MPPLLPAAGGSELMVSEPPDLPLARRQELENLAHRLEMRFRNLGLLDQALRHSSYAHDNPGSGPSNERLEFLGDAVLALTVSALLLARFPEGSEGEMSRGRAALVNARQLAALARRLGLGSYLLLGRGEEGQAGREKPSLLANALEALLGAVYLDRGLEAAAELTTRWFTPLISTALPGQDFKTSLQEFTHARYKAPPAYHLIAESGPGHARHFQVEVRLQDLPLAQGEGRTKKEAEQRAAQKALEILAAEGAAPDQDSAPPAKNAEE